LLTKTYHLTPTLNDNTNLEIGAPSKKPFPWNMESCGSASCEDVSKPATVLLTESFHSNITQGSGREFEDLTR